MSVNSRPGCEVRWVLVRFPNPLADGSGLLHVRRGPCLGLGGSSWLIPPRRSTRPPPPSPLSSRALSSEYWFLHKAGKAGRKKGARHQKQNTSHFVTSTAFINYEHRRIFLCAMCSKISAGQSATKFWCPTKNVTGYLFQSHEPPSGTWFSISF